MFVPATYSEEYLFSTVRLQTNSGSGTAFFYKPASERLCLITNKHVVKGAQVGSIVFRESSSVAGVTVPTDNLVELTFRDFESRWIGHPDQQVDLCYCPLDHLNDEFAKAGKVFYVRSVRSESIPSNETLEFLGAIEEVLMYGYPNGLYDPINGLPLVRRGITSIHPLLDYCGAPKGVIDIAAFPGSSGSPIFIISEGVRRSKNGAISDQPWLTFLGVLSSGPQMLETGEIVTMQAPLAKGEIQMKLMINLGYYEKARLIPEMIKT